MTRMSTKIAIAATTAMMTIAASGAAQAQGGYQWNSSQPTSTDATPVASSEAVRAVSAQALYLEQTGATRADAAATHDPGEIFAGYVGAYRL